MRAGVNRQLFIAVTAALDNESFGLVTARTAPGSGRPSVSTTNSNRTLPCTPALRSEGGYSGGGQYTGLRPESTAVATETRATVLDGEPPTGRPAAPRAG